MTKLVIRINGKKELISNIEAHLEHMRNNGWKRCPLLTSSGRKINLDVELIHD